MEKPPHTDIPEAVSGQPSNEVAKPSDSGTNNTSMMTTQNMPQQQQQQQQPQMQPEMMMGLGNVGMGGNTGNNMVGMQGMGNVMGMGGNYGISPPMADAISGMGNSMGQNPINMNQASSISNVISQQLRSGMITPAQAAVMTTKLRMAQSRNILGGAGGQSGNITGLAGANRQVLPGSNAQQQQLPQQQQQQQFHQQLPQQQETISSMGNGMGQDPINMNQASSISNGICRQLRSGMITPAQAAVMTTKLRMAQSRNILGGAGGQAGNITGLAGANRQVLPGSAQQQQLPQQQQQQQLSHQQLPQQQETISGMGNSMGQDPINMNQASSISNVISQQLRSGMITPAQAAVMTTKLRMAQSRNILGGAGGQAGNITGLAGANRQVLPGSNAQQQQQQQLSHQQIPQQQETISGMGNSMGQDPINMNQASSISNVISEQLRSGIITPAQAAVMITKLRMAQSRNILGGAGGQAGYITGLAGANRQVLPGSNAQQQQQQQQLSRQQQQETTSPLQAVLSPPQQQVGSPSMGIPQQQQASPQQMSQRTPMSPQLSSGAIHPPMSSGNQDGACPPSPQLSSQTMGSVSSMTNSPMDMQGVSKL